jgi:hypothetical protein
MAGKKRINDRKDSRGGKRAGSGRKPKAPAEYSDETKKGWEDAAINFKEKYGKTVYEAALDLIMDDKISGNAKSSILKRYNEALLIKETHTKSESTKRTGPIIGLPPIRGEDPALRVVNGND